MYCFKNHSSTPEHKQECLHTLTQSFPNCFRTLRTCQIIPGHTLTRAGTWADFILTDQWPAQWPDHTITVCVDHILAEMDKFIREIRVNQCLNGSLCALHRTS